MEEILVPPDHLYSSYEEAYSSLKAHGIQHGYGFVLKRSKPHNSDTKTRYYYHCDRFRKYQSNAKKLKTSTRSTGCPFKLVIFKVKHNKQWKLEVQDKHHNHSRSVDSGAHNVYRRRTSVQKDVIESMTHAGARPMQILAAIQKEDPNTLVSVTDIRSEREKIREKRVTALEGRPPFSTSESSPLPVTVATSLAVAPPPTWQPPSLEDFLADIESRKSQPVLYHYNDMVSAANFLVETGQEGDPAELVEARNMALATQGLFKSCTPSMAWNYHFGDMEAFYSEKFAQVDAQSVSIEQQDALASRPKRAAAIAAPEAWRSLGLRKRRRFD